jgi:uncharacterized protein (DUF1015 family)
MTMSEIKPFRAVRPKKEFVREVASCAYDVVNRKEAKNLARRNPKSFLHVVKSEIDLPDTIGAYETAVYEAARKRLKSMIQKGYFIKEDEPCFYIYRQKLGDHIQNGIVACVSLKEYQCGKIKKHELTRSEKEMDRTRHIDVVGAQTGPVFLTYKNSENIDALVKSAIREFPEYNFTADDEITHTVWIIKDNDVISEIQYQFSQLDALYIADGHHRAASAATVAKLREERNHFHTGAEEYNWMMSVLFPHNQLKILPYNRIVKDLGGLDLEGFMLKLNENFDISFPYEEKIPNQPHEFGMYIKKHWYKLAMKDTLPAGSGIVESLDVSILHEKVLHPILGIGDMRNDPRIEFVGGIRGTKELENLVDSEEYAVAFSLYPTAVNQLMALADAGLMLPPKSTWFEPKLRSGIFVHCLD